MKKIVLATSALLFLSIISNAQIKKGSKLLGGSIGFSSSESQYDNVPNSTSKSMNYYFSPIFGIAVKQNLVAGINFTYGQQTSRQVSSNVKQISSSYGVGLFARKYLSLTSKFYLVGQGTAYVDKSLQETKAPSPTPKYYTTTAGLSFSPSLAFAVSNKFHLEAGLGNLLNASYSVSKSRDETFSNNNQTSHSFSITSWANSQIPVNIGFRIFLGK